MIMPWSEYVTAVPSWSDYLFTFVFWSAYQDAKQPLNLVWLNNTFVTYSLWNCSALALQLSSMIPICFFTFLVVHLIRWTYFLILECPVLYCSWQLSSYHRQAFFEVFLALTTQRQNATAVCSVFCKAHPRFSSFPGERWLADLPVKPTLWLTDTRLLW